MKEKWLIAERFGVFFFKRAAYIGFIFKNLNTIYCRRRQNIAGHLYRLNSK